MVLSEKSLKYAQGKAPQAITNAIAQAYEDGYRDGYKDHENKIPVDLRKDEIEWVDLALPSGTLWAKDYMKKDNEILYLPFDKAKQYELPTLEQWQELFDNCEWEFDDSSSGITLYGIKFLGRNGNTLYFSTKGYKKFNDIHDVPNYGGGKVYFWIFNDENENDKTICVQGGKRDSIPYDLISIFPGYKLPIKLIRR